MTCVSTHFIHNGISFKSHYISQAMCIFLSARERDLSARERDLSAREVPLSCGQEYGYACDGRYRDDTGLLNQPSLIINFSPNE